MADVIPFPLSPCDMRPLHKTRAGIALDCVHPSQCHYMDYSSRPFLPRQFIELGEDIYRKFLYIIRLRLPSLLSYRPPHPGMMSAQERDGLFARNNLMPNMRAIGVKFIFINNGLKHIRLLHDFSFTRHSHP